MPFQALPNTAQYINTSPSQFQTTSTNDLIKQAYEQLKPYYTKLLNDAQGDLNTALGYLQTDYQQGTRYAQQDLSTSLKQLGLQFPVEQQNLENSLNQRGIALTQQPGTSNTTYAGGGQPATELANLNEDQQLRSEAVQRTAQRTNTQLGQTYQRGVTNATRQSQIYGEGLGQQLESQALSRAGVTAGLQNQSNAANLQGQMFNASLSGGGGGSSNVDPNNAASIQSAFPGYKSWNDTASIIGDFKNTGGKGKQ